MAGLKCLIGCTPTRDHGEKKTAGRFAYRQMRAKLPAKTPEIAVGYLKSLDTLICTAQECHRQ
eukprot:2192165-Pleurochrysis_carterae.AAC.1